MVKCYILMAGEGEYEDRVTWPVLVFLDRDKAIDTLKKCESISMRYENKTQNTVYRKMITKEYRALGIDESKKDQSGNLISIFTDWDLEEAHLDDGKFK